MVIWKKNLHVIESQHLLSAALHACTPVICSNFHHLNLRRALKKEARHVCPTNENSFISNDNCAY